MPENYKKKYDEARNKLLVDISEAASENRKLIFLDEICFTKQSIKYWDWIQKNENQRIDQRDIY